MPRLWDDSLYAGAAEFYAAGRMPYPDRIADVFRAEFGLDGTGRYLDLGCGPGSLTLLLAPYFAETVGLDADPGMLRVAARRDPGIRWVHAYAEDVAEPPGFRLITLAQSFHWMDRPVVAARIRDLLAPGGWCVHVGATTHEGDPDPAGRPHPPRAAIAGLIRSYLGPERRAGRSVVPGGETASGELDVFRAAGLTDIRQIEVPTGDVLTRTEDQVVASVLSLSWAAPHLFAGRLDDFVADLRRLLRSVSPDGVFAERLGDITLRAAAPPRPDRPGRTPGTGR